MEIPTSWSGCHISSCTSPAAAVCVRVCVRVRTSLCPVALPLFSLLLSPSPSLVWCVDCTQHSSVRLTSCYRVTHDCGSGVCPCVSVPVCVCRTENLEQKVILEKNEFRIITFLSYHWRQQWKIWFWWNFANCKSSEESFSLTWICFIWKNTNL